MIDNSVNHFSIPVRSSGCIASQILDCDTEGRVAAVFRSSFYMQSNAGFVCIGNENLGLSPLNLVTRASASTNWKASGVRVHDPVTISSGIVRVANRFDFHLTGSDRWSPESRSVMPEAVNTERGLEAFRHETRSRLPVDGLGRFITPGYYPRRHELVNWAACKPIEHLRFWLGAMLDREEQILTEAPTSIASLLGLGPGLTPSGDDFLGGVMIVLRTLRKADVCHRLWQQIQLCSEDTCNPISLAHLGAASRGMGTAVLHNAIAAIMQENPSFDRQFVNDIDSIGHTSD